MNKVLAFAEKHYSLIKALTKVFNHLNPRNRLCSRKVKLETGLTYLNGLKIKSKGTNNRVIIDDYTRILDCTVTFHGSNNTVWLKGRSLLHEMHFFMEDDNNTITVGVHNLIHGPVELATMEGTRIDIGDDGMVSSGVAFRTGDSHSITDLQGRRINRSLDIKVGNHVWVCQKVSCMKGVTVPDHCIVAATSTLCKTYDEPHCILAGVPARIVKRDIDWTTPRLKIED